MSDSEPKENEGELMHPLLAQAYERLRLGRMSRREFLQVATLLGLSASATVLAAACGSAPAPISSQPLPTESTAAGPTTAPGATVLPSATAPPSPTIEPSSTIPPSPTVPPEPTATAALPPTAEAANWDGSAGPYLITRLCLRDTACMDVCPVECIILGQPEEEWPWAYTDVDTCIECGACLPECPYEAIFPEDEVPSAYVAHPGQWISNTRDLLPDGRPFIGEIDGKPVKLLNARQMLGGELLDLTQDIPPNYDFFSDGPGYSALSG